MNNLTFFFFQLPKQLNNNMSDFIRVNPWTKIGIAFENSVDPDQMAYSETIWSGSTLFFIRLI